jgi:5'(3')-deoxyribonucleotidase
VRLAIDIDSTLHPYWDQLAEIAKRRFDVDLPYDSQATWAIKRLTPEQLKACIHETHTKELVLSAEPYPGAVETVTRWHEQGHFIHITSHRATDAHPHTSEWLTNIGLPHDELYCSYDKIARCVEIGIDVLIDDSPVNLENAVANGITAATIEHPWNKDVEGVIIAPDWAGLAERLQPVLT